MKLRNKKTGEIGNLVLNINPNRESYSVLSTENGDTICGNLVIADYDTLAELNEEWEDYEEPKEDYIRVITSFIHYVEEADDSFACDESVKKFVDKLKAWKRLKDKGFRFNDWHARLKNGVTIYARYDEGDEIVDDLNTLFGSEE